MGLVNLSALWAAVALLASVPMAAQSARSPIDVSKLGPQVGERAPEFSLKDQTGKIRTLPTGT